MKLSVPGRSPYWFGAVTDRLEWIWGRHPVAEALRAGLVRTILLESGRRPATILADIAELASRAGISIQRVAPVELEKVAPGQHTQGIAAQVVQREIASVAELLDSKKSGSVPFLLVLDQIQDPHNVGALVRSADAAGVNGLIVPEHRSASLHGIVSKASAGASSHLPIVEVTNLVNALNEVREAGIWVVGLDGTAPQLLYQGDFREPVALVIGSEERGIRRLTRQHCDYMVRLPMLGSVQSLNASVAGSIAMYEVVRQRTASHVAPSARAY